MNSEAASAVDNTFARAEGDQEEPDTMVITTPQESAAEYSKATKAGSLISAVLTIEESIQQVRLLKLLMDDGADVNGVDSLGKTALMHAATLGARAAVQAILTNPRIDVIGTDQLGNTPLILACSSGHESVARLLLEYLKTTKGLDAVRAHLDAQNNVGDTALALALKSGHVQCADLLSEYLQPVQFVLPSSDLPALGQESDLFCSLGEALAAEGPSLLKYLAYLDVRLLTLQRQPRMQQLFTVSRPVGKIPPSNIVAWFLATLTHVGVPCTSMRALGSARQEQETGGHPRCWMSIASPMLQLLRAQINAFQETNGKLAAAWESKVVQTMSGRAAPCRIPSAMQPKHWNPEWKLPNAPAAPLADRDNRQPFVKIGLKLPAPLLALFPSSPPIGCEIFGDLQMLLWNIEALGHIIASSYTDDKYGIVQRDLATIVSLLLNLYSESDKYSRLVTSQRIDRRQKSEIDSCLASLRDRLTDTVMKINHAFGNLNDVRLSDQERIVLKRLIDSNVTRN